MLCSVSGQIDRNDGHRPDRCAAGTIARPHALLLMAYDYDTNYIFAKPISSLKDESIITAFESVFNELKDKGHKPTFKVTDNQCTKPIKAFLQKENCR